MAPPTPALSVQDLLFLRLQSWGQLGETIGVAAGRTDWARQSRRSCTSRDSLWEQGCGSPNWTPDMEGGVRPRGGGIQDLPPSPQTWGMSIYLLTTLC